MKKECELCGDGVIWRKTTDDQDSPVWECSCCGKKLPRRVRKISTKRQEKNDKFTELFNSLL